MEYFAGTFRQKGYITILPQIRALFCWYLLLFWNSLRPTMNSHITSCFIYFTLPMYKLLINCFAKWFCVTVLLLDCIVIFFLVLVYCFSWPILFCHCYFLVTLMLELWWRWNILSQHRCWVGINETWCIFSYQTHRIWWPTYLASIVSIHVMCLLIMDFKGINVWVRIFFFPFFKKKKKEKLQLSYNYRWEKL